jgi:UDP-N-acetylmuramate dehydrogenase
MPGTALKGLNTFGIDCRAKNFISLKSTDEAIEYFMSGVYAESNGMILGGGSNLLFLADFNGTVVHPVIEGIEVSEENKNYVFVTAGAGVIWDDLVKWSVENNFGGLENLSLIPGSVGAVPVQNIGAYGVETAESVTRVETVSVRNGTVHYFNNNDCRFGYRDSVFKGELKNKFLITAVTFRLAKVPVLSTGYGSLADEVDKLGGLTLKNIRQAVINIRSSKLPDPAVLGNAGSFFKNPVIPEIQATELKKKYEQMPVYPDKNGLKKIAAGWLVESCGWKGFRIGDAGVHDKQALVLVNHGKAKGAEIYDLSKKIQHSVLQKFGIKLDREVELIGTI